MARLSAAAGLACSVVLMLLVLAAGQSVGDVEHILGAVFPKGSLPMPVRIYSKQNTALNVAVRDNAVVLATGNSTDRKQQWYMANFANSVDSVTFLPFALVNVETAQLVVIPSGSGQQLTLEAFDVVRARENLWTPGPELDAGFYEVFVTKDPSMTLNGLNGGVHDGTLVGIYPSTPSADNTLWKFLSTFPLKFP